MVMGSCWHRLVEDTKYFTKAQPEGSGGSGSSGRPSTQSPTLVQGGFVFGFCVCVCIYMEGERRRVQHAVAAAAMVVAAVVAAASQSVHPVGVVRGPR